LKQKCNIGDACDRKYKVSCEAEAQYDALVAYYEPLIQQAKAEVKEEILSECKAGTISGNDLLLAIKANAKSEVAREIFEELETTYMTGGIHPRMDGIVIKTPRIITIHEPEWQSFKSKCESKYGGQK
jgi:hypothetical protein